MILYGSVSANIDLRLVIFRSNYDHCLPTALVDLGNNGSGRTFLAGGGAIALYGISIWSMRLHCNTAYIPPRHQLLTCQCIFSF